MELGGDVASLLLSLGGAFVFSRNQTDTAKCKPHSLLLAFSAGVFGHRIYSQLTTSLQRIDNVEEKVLVPQKGPVAFVGLGAMGTHMAAHLTQAQTHIFFDTNAECSN